MAKWYDRLSSGATAGASVLSLYQTYRGYKDSKRQEQVLAQSAEEARRAREINIARARREGLIAEGAVYAELGARGIGLGSHAVANIMAEEAKTTEHEIAQARYLGDASVRNLMIQQQNVSATRRANLYGGLSQSMLLYTKHLDRRLSRSDITPGRSETK